MPGAMMRSMYELDKLDDCNLTGTFKKCPFCAEWIQFEAIKCRYCSEFLDGRPQQAAAPAAPATPGKKMLHSTPAMVMALLTAGPLALPLVWTHPRYSRFMKAAITIGVFFITTVLFVTVYRVSTNTLNQLKSLGLGSL